jgi:dolichyl-phosphate beta-glucosyltransferase
LSGPADAGSQVIDLSVVIPAYNEAGTIAATVRTVAGYLQLQPYSSELLVVDDGSSDGTGRLLASLAPGSGLIRVITHAHNQGKGAAVRTGMLAARGRQVFFMDADLSVPIDQLAGALAALESGDASIVIGSRRAAGARIERRQPRLREYLGYGFTWLSRLLIWPEIVDFTCGFKGFRRDDAQALFSALVCTDWAFDAEVLYLARRTGRRVQQYPVRWSHQKDSRVRFPRDIYRTLAALLRIRLAPRPATEGRRVGQVAVARPGFDE